MSNQLSASTLGGLLSLNVSMLPQSTSGLVSGEKLDLSGFGSLLNQQAVADRSVLPGGGAFLPEEGVSLPQGNVAQIQAKASGLMTRDDAPNTDELQRRLMHVADMLQKSAESETDGRIPANLATDLAKAIEQQLGTTSLPQDLQDELKQIVDSEGAKVSAPLVAVNDSSLLSPEQVDEFVRSLLAELRSDNSAGQVASSESVLSSSTASLADRTSQADLYSQVEKVKQLVAYLDELVLENPGQGSLPIPPVVKEISKALNDFLQQQNVILPEGESLGVDSDLPDELQPKTVVLREPLLSGESQEDSLQPFTQQGREVAVGEDEAKRASEIAENLRAEASKEAPPREEVAVKAAEKIEDPEALRKTVAEGLADKSAENALDGFLVPGQSSEAKSQSDLAGLGVKSTNQPEVVPQKQVMEVLKKVLLAHADEFSTERGVETNASSQLKPATPEVVPAVAPGVTEIESPEAAVKPEVTNPREELLQLVSVIADREEAIAKAAELVGQVEPRTGPSPTFGAEALVSTRTAENLGAAVTTLTSDASTQSGVSRNLLDGQRQFPSAADAALARAEVRPDVADKSTQAARPEANLVGRGAEAISDSRGQAVPLVGANEVARAEGDRRSSDNVLPSDALLQRLNASSKPSADSTLEQSRLDKAQSLLDVVLKTETAPSASRPRVLSDNLMPVGDRLTAAIDAAQQLSPRVKDQMDSVPSQKSDLLAGAAAILGQSAQSPVQTQRAAAEGPMFMMPNQVRLNTPAWNNALGERAVMIAAQNARVAQIQLDPPELGSLNIRVQVNQDQISLNFTSPHAHVRDAVEQSLPRLREMFAEQGLALQDSSVSDQGCDGDNKRGLGDSEGGADAQYVGGDQVEGNDQQAGESARSMSLVDYYA
ncbi:flagellar hook-length control protein FliK [Neptuniibacter sp.]|uniref:flagellar hook-length control protein FliK n=1 Tax=Neptuniibacter sp. TaxID=1962643 RepID=UPI0026337E06|nr:flagellar hook-length control protein FliK [Neptuniibacter sp.]MCP4596519.1 hypothetical protein [Neptuniibacter sp.]